MNKKKNMIKSVGLTDKKPSSLSKIIKGNEKELKKNND